VRREEQWETYQFSEAACNDEFGGSDCAETGGESERDGKTIT